MKRGLFALPIPGVVLLAYNVVVLLSSDPVGALSAVVFRASLTSGRHSPSRPVSCWSSWGLWPCSLKW